MGGDFKWAQECEEVKAAEKKKRHMALENIFSMLGCKVHEALWRLTDLICMHLNCLGVRCC